tara:strand:- start:772 stop:1116 length:345 start_codon:yes stop_codon:yes gene_type:complete
MNELTNFTTIVLAVLATIGVICITIIITLGVIYWRDLAWRKKYTGLVDDLDEVSRKIRSITHKRGNQPVEVLWATQQVMYVARTRNYINSNELTERLDSLRSLHNNLGDKEEEK